MNVYMEFEGKKYQNLTNFDKGRSGNKKTWDKISGTLNMNINYWISFWTRPIF
jgi:hypothetical protein